MSPPPDWSGTPWLSATRELLSTLWPARGWTWDWFGSRIGALRPEVAALADDDLRREWLIDEVSNLIYKCFYSTGGPVSTNAPSFTQPLSRGDVVTLTMIEPAKSLLIVKTPSLDVSNEIEFETEAGISLRITRAEGDHWLVDSDGQTLFALPSGSSSIQPGFAYFRSTGRPTDHDLLSTRIYLNNSASRLTEVVEALIDIRQTTSPAFSFKVLTTEARDRRCDSCVVYCTQEARDSLLAAFEQRLLGSGLLDEAIPVFTMPIAPGIGCASDPGGGRSFGQQRCSLLATTLVECDRYSFGRGVDQERRLDAIVESFEQAGLSFEQPWRNP